MSVSHDTFTIEQITTIGPSDGAEGRRRGWTHLLNTLERTLKETNS